jgi:hypothetical protein
MAQHVPNFFIAGAPKAGTTSLYLYLAQHPQVYMSPIKEPTFFGATDLLAGAYGDGIVRRAARDRIALRAHLERSPTTAGSIRDVLWVFEWEDYLELFRNVRDETAIGEASTGYFWLPTAADTIRSTVPGARLIFMLRDPAERVFSSYLVRFWRDPLPSFRSWFHAAQHERDLGWSAVEAGRYATHLQRYAEVFPREQLRIYLHEDYRADARAVLRDACVFLGVDPDHPIDVSRRHNETVVPRFPRLHTLRRRLFGSAFAPRWIPDGARRALWRLYYRQRGDLAMDPADRRMVIDYYRDEIVRTADFLGRDLAGWLG